MRSSLTPQTGTRIAPVQKVLMGGLALLAALALAWTLMHTPPEHDTPLHKPKTPTKTQTTQKTPAPK